MKQEDDKDFDTLASIWMHMKQQIDNVNEKSNVQIKLQNNSQQVFSQVKYNPKNISIQIQKQQEELFQKNTKLIDAQQKINELEEINIKLNKEIETLQKEKELILQKFEMIEEVIDSFQMDKSSNRLIRLENDQLKQDITRLLGLLKQTKEFNDIQIENNQHYIQQGEFQQQKSKVIENGNKKVEVQVQEEIFWIPKKVIEIINNIEMNYSQKNELLINLNSTFYEYYTAKINKLKQQADNEINNLKRQLNSRIPYDGIMTQKKTERNLKVQFSDQKSESKKSKETINRNLFQKVDEQLKVSKVIDKTQIFMEGATWIMEKINNEILSYEIDVKSLNQELSIKIDTLINEEDLAYKNIVNKIFKWITDASEEQIYSLKEKLNCIMESTQSRATTRRTFQITENVLN
ncbi:unnamed protein product [Paramecium sonneborni]|uniref:Uncharacterized protein n=1 Tax=Paramecium sonneborni TaxID=65129 RepID=A0A8S1R7N4_9CILI|nr:unnamed protein product [Paramecium sonneborni]